MPVYTATGEKSENIHAIYYADRAALMQAYRLGDACSPRESHQRFLRKEAKRGCLLVTDSQLLDADHQPWV